MPRKPKVAIFGPNPLLEVTVEAVTADVGDDIHFHPAGQGVWVARMAAEMGAEPVLCGFAGGESGKVLRRLLEELPIELRLVETDEASASYIHDRRDGTRKPVAQSASVPPSRHEVDDLFSITCAAAIDADVLVVCNPYPSEMLPLEICGSLVADVKANGTPALVHLSSPRLANALEATTEITHAVGGETDLSLILETIAKRGRALVEAHSLLILLEEGGEPRVVAAAGEFDNHSEVRLAVASSAPGLVFQSRQASRLRDLDSDLLVESDSLGMGGESLLVPLIIRGESVGVLVALDPLAEDAGFGVESERVLGSFAASAATAVATAQSAAEVSVRNRIEAAERERGRWARELHDESLQSLAGLRVILSAARRGDNPQDVDGLL